MSSETSAWWGDPYDAMIVVGMFGFMLFVAPGLLFALADWQTAGIYTSGVWTVTLAYESGLVSAAKGQYSTTKVEGSN